MVEDKLGALGEQDSDSKTLLSAQLPKDFSQCLRKGSLGNSHEMALIK